MKIWIATAVDTSDSADGKARVIGTFKNQDEAYEFVTNDIQEWVDDRAGEDVECDFIAMHAHVGYGEVACEWNVEEVEVK